MAFLLVITFTPGTGWSRHAEWWGWRWADAFFPAFLLVTGVGLAYQTRRGIPWPRLLRRFVVLVLAGLALNAAAGTGADLDRLRVPGVLQRIALVGLLGAVFVAATGRRWWAAVAGAVVVSLLWAVTLAVFGRAHLYQGGTRGHDPEGLASSTGALATLLAGYGAGAVLASRRAEPVARRVGPVLAMAAGWLALTPLFALLQPVGKRLWTASFVSVTAAGGLVVVGQRHPARPDHRCRLRLRVSVPRGVSGLEVGDCVGCHQHDDSGGMGERRVEDLTDVWRTLSGELDGGGPLHGGEVDAPQDLEHRAAQVLVASVDDEHRTSIGGYFAH